MQYLFSLFINQILTQPFLLLAIVVFIGYIAMKKSVSQAFSGAAKAAIGVLIMGMGSGPLSTNFGHLINVLRNVTGIQGVGLNTYPAFAEAIAKMDAVTGVAGSAMTLTLYTMLVSFILNLVFVALRKFTKISAVYLTGNAMLGNSALFVFFVWRFLGTSPVMTVVLASVFVTIYQAGMATLLIKPSAAIAGREGMTVGHINMTMDFVAWKVAPKLGDPKKENIENMKLPSSLGFLQDSLIASFLIMFLTAAVVALVTGKAGVEWLHGPEAFNNGTYKNTFIFLLWIAFTLSANLWVLLAGVRMFVSELMMSFKGISEKVLPGAVAAVDCAAFYGFAPKSVVFGFIAGMVGEIVGIILLIVFKSPIVAIPGFIPMFFDNATVGVFANKFGGWKALLIICFVNGLIQIFGSILAVSLANMTWWYGSNDSAILYLAFMFVLKLVGGALGIPVRG